MHIFSNKIACYNEKKCVIQINLADNEKIKTNNLRMSTLKFKQLRSIFDAPINTEIQFAFNILSTKIYTHLVTQTLRFISVRERSEKSRKEEFKISRSKR